MSKLLKLKNWITVPEAARHLSVLLHEAVTEADMLRLALDGHITLSVNFVNGVYGRIGTLVPKEQAEWITVPSLDGKRAVEIPKGVPLDDGTQILLAEQVRMLKGVWDLPLVGAEKLDVENRFQQLTDGPEVESIHLDGTFVRSDAACWCQIQSEFEPRRPGNNFYPAGGLPEDAVLVFRTAELGLFQAKLSEAEDAQRKATAPLDTRSETTYLTIIGALLALVLGKTPAGKPQSVFNSQAAIIDALLAHHANVPGISKTTLEVKFAEARRRLNSN